MKKSTLSICLLSLLAGIALFCWKALPGRASDATNARERKDVSTAEQMAQVDSDDEPDEILEFTKTLPPPKSMLGAAGACAYVIRNVMPNSPAAEAGLKVGDLVLSVNGKQVTSDKVMLKLTQKEPGTPVTLIVMRNNLETKEVEQLRVTLPLAAWNYPQAK